MYTFWQDIRFGLRVLRKNLGFTIIAVITLALGIGANTAIFSVMNQILLRRLPVRNPGELVVLHAPGPNSGRVSSDGDVSESFSYPMYKGLRDGAANSIAIIARSSSDASLASQGQTERGRLELVTGNYFNVLGVAPAIGRVFDPQDDNSPGGNQLAVLSYNYWTRRFAQWFHRCSGWPIARRICSDVDGQTDDLRRRRHHRMERLLAESARPARSRD